MRKLRKRVIAGIMFGAVLFGTAACGTDGGKEDVTPVPEATATVVPEEQETTEQPEATATPEPTATPTPEPTHAPAKNEGIMIPAEYRKLKKEASGTVESVTYTTKDYYKNGEEVIKPAYVYLPYGYDENKQYDVLYLMHSGGSDEAEWGLHKEFSTAKLILDNLIYYGDIEPLIVVCPNGRTGVDYGKRADDSIAFKDFGMELRNDLIPYIDANYATYAEYNPEGYDLTAARDHRAMAGFSFGAMQSINIGLCECLDIMSWFGAFSPATATFYAEEIAKFLEEFEPYDINYIYEICGDVDKGCLYAGYDALMDLPELTDKVVKRENLMMQVVPGTHEQAVAQLGLYNFLQLVFKQ